MDAALTEAAQEMTAWLRVLALPQLRAELEVSLDSPEKRRAYAASDGTKTTRDVAAASGASKSAVGRWWAEWRATGLAVERSSGQVCRLVDPNALGLPKL